jgi:hypothetical protein
MGCRNSRAGTEENTLVTACESKLGFSGHSPAELEAAFYKAKLSGSLTDDRLKKLMKALCQTDSIDQLKAAKTESGEYDWQKLLTLGLLLSLGTEQEKGEAIWDLYDPSAQEEMDKPQVEFFFTQMIDSALDFIPSLTQSSKFNPDRLQTWLSNLKTKKGKFAKDMTSLYLGKEEKLNKKRFLSILTGNSQANLTNCVVIRSRMEEMKMMPSKFANAFATKGFSTNISE